MKNKWLFNFTSLILTTVLLNPAIWAQTSDDSDDSKVKRFEVGGQISGLLINRIDASDEVFRQFGFPESTKNYRFLDIGFGGRFTYNVNRRLAFEGEVNYFPSSPTVNELVAARKFANVPYSGGKKAQFLGGVKYGFRHSKYGFFGKIRPGAIRFTAYPKVAGRFVSPMSDDVLVFSTEVPATFFNVDVGGVFEYYPNRRTVFRVDVGDTIIRYNAQQPKEINPSFTRHNLQTSVGFGFRF